MRKLATGANIVVHLALPAFADFTGPVVSALDGDTLEVLHHQRADRLRLLSKLRLCWPQFQPRFNHVSSHSSESDTITLPHHVEGPNA